VEARHHLLVIDDESHIGRIVRMQFEKGPYRVSTAEDGPAGLVFLDHHQDVDGVLLDLNMPGMNGVEVLEVIKKDQRLSAIPILILTAAGDTGQVERVRTLGCAGIVTKPFSPKKLYRQVASLLGDEPDAELGGEA
jgi:CheY-like chemotaxis protein